MLLSLSLYYSEKDNLEMFEECVQRYTLIMSLHLMYKTDETGYTSCKNVLPTLYRRLNELRNGELDSYF